MHRTLIIFLGLLMTLVSIFNIFMAFGEGDVIIFAFGYIGMMLGIVIMGYTYLCTD